LLYKFQRKNELCNDLAKIIEEVDLVINGHINVVYMPYIS